MLILKRYDYDIMDKENKIDEIIIKMLKKKYIYNISRICKCIHILVLFIVHEFPDFTYTNDNEHI